MPTAESPCPRLRAAAEADALKAAIRAICDTERWECVRYLWVDSAAGVVLGVTVPLMMVRRTRNAGASTGRPRE